MNRLPAILFVSLLGISLFATIVGGQASCPNNDANTCTDAGSNRATALGLQNGRHYGRLTAGSDQTDYYKFVPGSRQVIEILLLSDPNNDFTADLQRISASEANPTARARGAAGARVIQFHADLSDTWYIRVTGATSGRYELTLLFRNENDANKGEDAPDQTNALSSLPAFNAAEGNRTVRGNLTNGDPGDMYRINLGTGRNSVTATIQFSESSQLAIDIVATAQTSIHTKTQRSGTGFATVTLVQSATATINAESITFRITPAGTNTNSDDYQSGHYVLMIRVNRGPTNGDADGSTDAADDVYGALGHKLKQGLRMGRVDNGDLLNGGADADPRDVYVLDHPTSGRVIHFGIAPHRASGGSAAPLVRLTILYEPPGGGDLVTKAQLDACDQAEGIAMTGAAGRWILAVEEAVWFNGCSEGNTPRSGDYVLMVHLSSQTDVAAGDAPADTRNAPPAGSATLNSAWFDANDGTPSGGQQRYDSFDAGLMQAGSTLRAGVFGTAPGMQFRIQVFDANQTALPQTSTGNNGVMRLYATVPRRENYTVRFELMSNPVDGVYHSGIYRYSVSQVLNDPPAAVTLNAPADADIGVTSVKLTWSQSADSDFSKYEVHASKTPGFAPSASTRKATITTKAQTTYTATGLEAGQVYEFLVRVEDASTLATNSNRRTVDLKEINLNNQAPTLSNPSVSPTSGQTGTQFSYRVTYRDADGHDPIQSSVFIDGEERIMTRSSGTATAGAVYQYQTTLAAGNHHYYFAFNDGDASVRDPSGTATHAGPTVTQQGNTAPTVTASANPTQGSAPLQVQFTANAQDSAGDSLSYSWDFDNADGVTADSSQQNPTHTYTTSGTKTASVRVTDQHGAIGTATVTINVGGSNNQLPTVSASATPTNGNAPLSVQFAATATDADGTIAGYEWDFDNSNGLTVQSTQQNPTHTYTSAAAYVATVTAIDNRGGRQSATVTVQVRSGSNVPPTLQVVASPPAGAAPLVVTFTAEAADANGDVLVITWDFDASNGVQTDATGVSVTRTFTTPGQFTVLAIARDTSGAQATDTVIVTARAPGGGGSSNPLVYIQATPMRGKAPLAVDFSADTTRLPMPAVRHEWDFGDASQIDTEPATRHVFQFVGRYVVRLNVTDQAGTSYESTVTIEVEPKAKSPSVPLSLTAALLVAAVVLSRRRRPMT